MSNRSAAAIFAAVIMAVSGPPAFADPAAVTPFATRTHHPLFQGVGLPVPTSATVLEKERTEVRVCIDAASHFMVGAGNREHLVLDGETWRTDLSLRFGMGSGVELGIEIPYLSHTGGVLDGIIDGWHEASGLPTGGREDLPSAQLDFRYVRDGTTLIQIPENASGLGDVRISGAFQLLGTDGKKGRHLALHTSIKLPTGSSHDLTGSGSAGLSIHLSGRNDRALSRIPLPILRKMSLFGTGGLLFAGSGEVLDRQQRHLVAFGSMGAGCRAAAWVVPKVQINWHSPIFQDSSLKQIDAWSAQLIFGASFTLSETTTLDVAIAEDIAVDTAPDVAFHLSLRKRF